MVVAWPGKLSENTISPATVPVCSGGSATVEEPLAIVKVVEVDDALPQLVDEKQTPGLTQSDGKSDAFGLKDRETLPVTGAGTGCADCTCTLFTVVPGC